MAEVSSGRPSPAPTYRFAVVSTCPEPWGGSEELWWGAATIIAKKGHRVAVFKTEVDFVHPRIQKLKSLGCPVYDLKQVWNLPPVVNALLPVRWRLTELRKQRMFLKRHLKTQRPDLVMISQGDNHGGLAFAHLCRTMKQPYVLIAHSATDRFWPSDRAREGMRTEYENAVECFFVSRHNQRLTEDQIGVSLAHGRVVRNPFLVSAQAPLPWPGGEQEAVRLACVGRLYIPDKGQDILLRVLARAKWRERKLHVSFFGRGIHREGMIALAARLGVENVSFEGHVADVPGIWKEHHALILPSRAEGLPLVIVEAMMCGRPAIVTDVGGNAELLEEGLTGFVAAGAVEEMVDDALERAWNRRGEWKAMGEMAARRVREFVPQDPAQVFADYLLGIVTAKRNEHSLL